MDELKYLKVVSVEEKLPKPGSTTVAFVPGQGFQGALYNEEGASPKWRSTITRQPIEPTHWLDPNTSILNELMTGVRHAHDLLLWFKVNKFIIIPDGPDSILNQLQSLLDAEQDKSVPPPPIFFANPLQNGNLTL